jgi:hypothetical protein
MTDGAVSNIGGENDTRIVPENTGLRVDVQRVLQLFSKMDFMNTVHYLIRHPGLAILG